MPCLPSSSHGIAWVKERRSSPAPTSEPTRNSLYYNVRRPYRSAPPRRRLTFPVLHMSSRRHRLTSFFPPFKAARICTENGIDFHQPLSMHQSKHDVRLHTLSPSRLRSTLSSQSWTLSTHQIVGRRHRHLYTFAPAKCPWAKCNMSSLRKVISVWTAARKEFPQKLHYSVAAVEKTHPKIDYWHLHKRTSFI